MLHVYRRVTVIFEHSSKTSLMPSMITIFFPAIIFFMPYRESSVDPDQRPGLEVIKIVLLNSAEHKISPGHKC